MAAFLFDVCPVCGSSYFQDKGSYDICLECGSRLVDDTSIPFYPRVQMSNSTKAIPAGFLENSRGDLVREENIHAKDKLREQLVRDLCGRMEDLARHTAEVKKYLLDDFAAFIQVLAEEMVEVLMVAAPPEAAAGLRRLGEVLGRSRRGNKAEDAEGLIRTTTTPIRAPTTGSIGTSIPVAPF